MTRVCVCVCLVDIWLMIGQMYVSIEACCFLFFCRFVPFHWIFDATRLDQWKLSNGHECSISSNQWRVLIETKWNVHIHDSFISWIVENIQTYRIGDFHHDGDDYSKSAENFITWKLGDQNPSQNSILSICVSI